MGMSGPNGIPPGPETLVFVDADGVINVGIRDSAGQAPLLLCEANLARCREQKKCTSGPVHVVSSVACRVVGHGEEDSYAKYATQAGSNDITPEFAARLAEIIRAAGPRCMLVLSSSWRKPNHVKRVLALEAAISKFADKPTKFTAKTGPGGDEPHHRLHLIGEFVRQYTAGRDPKLHGDLRVLVLDDFAASHPRDWRERPGNVDSVGAVEDFWRKCSACPENTAVKLVHTYEEWVTEHGVRVQIGSGLTPGKASEACRFLLDQGEGALVVETENRSREPTTLL